MSHKKLLGFLVVPAAIGIISSGAVVVSQRTNVHAASPQATQQNTEQTGEHTEPGDAPDKPGQTDAQESPDQKDAADKAEAPGSEANN